MLLVPLCIPFYSIRTFVTTLKRLIRAFFLKRVGEAFNTSGQLLDLTAVLRLWWIVCVLEEVPGIILACSAILANSGVIKKYFVRAVGFCVMAINPHETFIDLHVFKRVVNWTQY